MQHQGILVSSRVQWRNMPTLISKQPIRLPARAIYAGFNAPISRLQAGVSCKAEHGPGVSPNAAECDEPQPRHGPSPLASARLVLLTCVMAGSVSAERLLRDQISPEYFSTIDSPPVPTWMLDMCGCNCALCLHGCLKQLNPCCRSSWTSELLMQQQPVLL